MCLLSCSTSPHVVELEQNGASIGRGQLEAGDFPTESLGQQLGQQIIGMGPSQVGTPRTPEEEAERAEAKRRAAEEDAEAKVGVILGS